VDEADLAAGVRVLEARGFRVQVAEHALGRKGYLSGTDEERLSDLQEALDDPAADAVWFARGGYGTTRLLPRLSCEGLAAHPKLLAGFSDATALFAWAAGVPGVRCLYGPSVQEMGREGVCDLESLWAALEGAVRPIPGRGPALPAGPFPAVGGCLTLCSVLSGTPWQPETGGCWLFLEDVGEPLYRLDRMLTHLAQTGWFDRAAGVLLGGFTGMGEGERPEHVARIARELLGPRRPLISGLPVGHLKGKMPLPLGLPLRWDGKALRAEGERDGGEEIGSRREHGIRRRRTLA
jgi:muramoyltetrapeptide carboxypeptidase